MAITQCGTLYALSWYLISSKTDWLGLILQTTYLISFSIVVLLYPKRQGVWLWSLIGTILWQSTKPPLHLKWFGFVEACMCKDLHNTTQQNNIDKLDHSQQHTHRQIVATIWIQHDNTQGSAQGICLIIQTTLRGYQQIFMNTSSSYHVTIYLCWNILHDLCNKTKLHNIGNGCGPGKTRQYKWSF